ncbi:MAG: hypothetical protein WC310_04985 [Patescibacteria group bacterium]|jgi:hypothetical protein
MMLYRDVLKRAWYVTWRNKALWLFGFLALFWGIGGVYEVVAQGFRLASRHDFYFIKLWNAVASAGVSFGSLKTLFLSTPLYGLLLVGIFVVFVLLLLFFYWIFTCSQITVIKQVADIDSNARSNAFSSFYKSRQYFWPVLGINLINKIVTFVLLVIFTYGIMALVVTEALFVSQVFYLLSFILFVVVILVLSFLVVYGTIYISVYNKPFIAAIQSAWKLFINNWLVSLEVAAILFVITVLVAIATGVLVTILSGILYFVSIIVLFINLPILYFVSFAILMVIFVIMVFIIAAVLSTFQLAVWVELFDHLESNRITSKLQRIASAKLGVK